jgi:uncharacterized protein YbjQ (UPF0145 family)
MQGSSNNPFQSGAVSPSNMLPQTVPPGTVPHEMVTTAFVLDGYQIVRSLGVVRGITVRSRSVVGNFGAALQTLVGGKISILENLCEKTRNEAFHLMIEHAAQLGANAVIGARYDATDLMQGVTEVLAYGTAVVVAPLRDSA